MTMMINHMKTIKKNKTVSRAGLDTLLIEEVLTEGAKPYEELLFKLKHAKPGTERYIDLVCELAVAANVIAVKAKVAEKVIEEYLDSLPDDDDDN